MPSVVSLLVASFFLALSSSVYAQPRERIAIGETVEFVAHFRRGDFGARRAGKKNVFDP